MQKLEDQLAAQEGGAAAAGGSDAEVVRARDVLAAAKGALAEADGEGK